MVSPVSDHPDAPLEPTTDPGAPTDPGTSGAGAGATDQDATDQDATDQDATDAGEATDPGQAAESGATVAQPGVVSALPRALLVLLPAIAIATVGASTIWGESGLLARGALQRELVDANAELAAVERENQRLLRELRLMDEDPVVLERLVAEELGWGREGDTIIRFVDED